jgi:hypothetical protein
MPDTEAGSAAAVELIAVVAAATADEPRVLTVDGGRLLPSGPFESAEFSLQAGLRSWVERQTRHALGYVEQLYTFADKSRVDAAGRRIVSIGYLGLTREARGGATPGAGWRSWYAYFRGRTAATPPPNRPSSPRCAPGPRRATITSCAATAPAAPPSISAWTGRPGTRT